MLGPYTQVSAAVAAAADGDVIRVAEGIFGGFSGEFFWCAPSPSAMAIRGLGQSTVTEYAGEPVTLDASQSILSEGSTLALTASGSRDDPILLVAGTAPGSALHPMAAREGAPGA